MTSLFVVLNNHIRQTNASELMDGGGTVPAPATTLTWRNRQWMFGKSRVKSKVAEPSLFSSFSRGASSHVAASLFRYQGRIVRIDCIRAQLRASLPLSPVTRTSLTEKKKKNCLTIMDFTTWWFLAQTDGHRNNSSRCNDRTSWYIATLQCSTGERPYGNHATEGRPPVISVDFEFCALLCGSYRCYGRGG